MTPQIRLFVCLGLALVGTARHAVAQTSIGVATELQLRNAIFQASNDFASDGVANGGVYTITLLSSITLTQSLPMIRAAASGGAAIVINGGGFTIDANNTGRAFFVESGTVEISNLVINNARAEGGAGGSGSTFRGGGAGGGLGAGAAIFVNSGAAVTVSNVVVGNAAAQGGAGGEGGASTVSGGGGGGGGIGGAGGNGSSLITGGGGGGGGGYQGAGGSAGTTGGGGGGGEFGDGGGGIVSAAGGGGGGQQGRGGNPQTNAGGGGGGAALGADGADGSGATGGAGGGSEAGAGGDQNQPGQDASALGGGGGGAGAQGGGTTGGAGQASGGGGGGGGSTGAGADGGAGGVGAGGGGGGASSGNGGAGGDFGGGGGGGGQTVLGLNGGNGGFGGGGGGARVTATGATTGGTGGFGGGGGAGITGGTAGDFAGQGGSGVAADGGGGAALGGAVFVRDGGTLTITDGTFGGTYSVTGGSTGGTGGATAGQALGSVMFLDTNTTTTLDISGTDTLEGANALAGGGTLNKDGSGILEVDSSNANFTGSANVLAGTLRLTGNDALTGAQSVSVDATAFLDLANTTQTLQVLNLQGTADIGSGTLTLESPTFDTSFLSGSISGSGGLFVNGANTSVNVTAQQLYVGGTTVSNGAMLVLNDALSSAGALTINSSGYVQVNADQTVSALSGTGGFLGLCACSTLTVNQSTSTIFGGEIFFSGGSLVKTGSGTLALTGDNSSWFGNTTVSGGVIALSGDNGLGVGGLLTLDGGGIRSDAVINFANSIVLDPSGGTWDTNGNDTTLFGTLSGLGGLTKLGNGSLTVTDVATYAGATTIDAGTLALDINGDISDSSGVNVGSGATFDIGGVGAGVTAITTLSGSGAVQLGNNGLVITNASTEFSGTIDGGGGVLVDSGTLTLSGVSTYVGDTGIADGATLALKDAGSLTDSYVTFDPSATQATLDISQTTSGAAIGGLIDFTGGGVISLGSRTLTINQSGFFMGVIQDGGIAGGTGGGLVVGANALLELSGANTFTGATVVQGDAALFLSDAGAIAASSGLNLAGANALFDISCCGGDRTIKDLTGVAGSLIGLGDNSLTVGTANSTTFAGDFNGFGGIGGLVKAGTGTLVLTGTVDLLGATTVTSGLLQLGTTTNTSAVVTGDVNVQAGGTLGGTGTIMGTVNVGAGATLAPGASIGTLTTGTLVLDAASILDFEFGAPGTSDRVIVNGDLTLAGTLNVIDAGGFGAGVYRLFDYTGLFTDGGLVIGATPTGVSASQLQVQTSVANQVNLISSFGATMSFWDGAGPANNGVVDGGSGVWSATAPLWTDAAGVMSGPVGAGAFAIFQGAPGTVTVDNSAGAISVTGLQFAAGGYEIAGGALTLGSPLTTIRVGDGSTAGAAMTATISAPLVGTGGLLKTDLGTLTLSGNNTYSGATQIDAGTLRMGSSTALGTSGLLTVNAAGTLDINGFSLGLGSIGGTGTVALGGGALTLGLNNVSSTFAGRLTGSGVFTKTGAGTLTLSGANTHTGLTNVDAGTLRAGAANVFGFAPAISISSGATLDLNDFSQSLGSLSGSGDVALGSATLVTGTDGRLTQFTGSITGSGSVVKAGGGTWILGGFNSFSGATQIEGGTLQLGSSGALFGTSGVGIAGGGTLDMNGFSHTFRALSGSGNISLGGAALTLGAADTSSRFDGIISGAGSVRKIGAGVLQLTGANSFTGGTFVDAGALLGDATSLRGDIVNDALVVFDQATAGIFTGAISGRGGVIKQGDGLLTLTGRHSYGGGTLVSAGTLAGTTQSLHGGIDVAGALRFEQAFDGLFTGALSGRGSVAKGGAGTLQLTGAHQFSGLTTVEAGTLWLDGVLGGSVTVRSGARFAIGAFPTTASGVAETDATASGSARAPRASWMTASADVTASTGALGRTHVTGDIFLQPGSTYEAHINASGDSVLLSSGGTVRAGAATIVIDGNPADYPRVVQAALITSAGGVLGSPTIQTAPGLESIVTSDAQSLFVTVLNSSASLGAVATNLNGESVGAAFDRLRPSAAGDLRTVTRELAALSDAGLATALDAISGEIFATSMHVTAIDAEGTADRIRGEVTRRRRPTATAGADAGALATAAAASATAWGNGRRFWGHMGGERATLDATTSSTAANGHVGGFAIGVDWTSGRGWLAGAGGGYSLGEMTLSGGTSDADTRAPRAFGYAGYARGRWTLQAGGTIGRTSYETRRNLVFAATLDPRFGTEALFGGVDRTATSESHGVDTGGWFEARADLVRGSWLLQPGGGVRGASYGRSAWAESGADALAFSGGGQSIGSVQADAGVRVARLRGRLRPSVSASYRRELGDGATSLTLQLSPEAAGRFTIAGTPFAADRVLGTIGLSMDMWSFGYGVDAASGQTRHTVNFGVRFE